MGPDACIAVCLKFECDGQLAVLPGTLNFRHHTRQILDMVPYLMGDHIRLGKITRCLEFPPELVEKAEIEIKVVVTRTIERPGRRIGHSASGRDAPGKQDELRFLIPDARLLRQYLPEDLLRTAENYRSEFPLVVRGIIRGRRLLDLGLLGNAFEQLPRVSAKQADDRRQHQNPQPAAAKCDASAHSPSVFYVRTALLSSPTHIFAPFKFSIPKILSILPFFGVSFEYKRVPEAHAFSPNFRKILTEVDLQAYYHCQSSCGFVFYVSHLTKEVVMIKLDIVNQVAEKTGVPKQKAEQVVDSLFNAMKDALAQGKRIELRGFGVFVVKPRKRGVGRNPRTGKEVPIPAGKTIRFKPGKELSAHAVDE